jgi:hypothetical protein
MKNEKGVSPILVLIEAKPKMRSQGNSAKFTSIKNLKYNGFK